MTFNDNNTPKHDPDTPASGRGQKSGIVWMLGLVAVLVLGGLILMTMGGDNVATRSDMPAATTGATTRDAVNANVPAKSQVTEPGAKKENAPAFPKQ